MKTFRLGLVLIDLIFAKIDTLETFYGYYVWKWGYLGTVIMCFFYVWIILRLGEIKAQSGMETYSSLVKSLKLSTLIFLIFFGFFSAITERYKIFPIYFTLIGYLITIVYEEKKNVNLCIEY